MTWWFTEKGQNGNTDHCQTQKNTKIHSGNLDTLKELWETQKRLNPGSHSSAEAFLYLAAGLTLVTTNMLLLVNMRLGAWITENTSSFSLNFKKNHLFLLWSWRPGLYVAWILSAHADKTLWRIHAYSTACQLLVWSRSYFFFKEVWCMLCALFLWSQKYQFVVV